MKSGGNTNTDNVRQLIERTKSRDDDAFRELCSVYDPLISSRIDLYYDKTVQIGGDREDISQEALVAFYNAALRYDLSESAVTFGLYARICITNRLISYARKLNKYRNSVEASIEKKKNDSGPQRPVEIPDGFENSLSGYEREVFSLYRRGLSYREIAEKLGKTGKSVDNAIFRIRSKIRRV